MRKSRRKINLGIVGLGWPGQRHAEGIAGSANGRLYACADSNDERRASFVEEFAPEKSFASYEEMLADPALDAVVICLPNFLHFPSSLAALGAGKHVFCEKPPTLNVAEMRVLQEEATKRGRLYFFGRQSRFSPELLAAKQLIEAGRLGEIYFAKAVFIRSRGIPVGIGGWFTEKARSGGGAMIDLGVHALDSVWYLMGTPRPLAVSAQVFQKFAHTADVPVNDVEDGAYGMVRFDNGAQVQFEISWAANLTDDDPLLGRHSGQQLDGTRAHQLDAPWLQGEHPAQAARAFRGAKRRTGESGDRAGRSREPVCFTNAKLPRCGRGHR